MIARLFHGLVFTALLAVTLLAVFFAWWLALLLAFALMLLGGLRQLFGSRPVAGRGTVVIEGEGHDVTGTSSRLAGSDRRQP